MNLLIGWLIFLIGLAAFFSFAETSMMSIDRYKLRHLAKNHNKTAIKILKMLRHPERLLSFILIGNTFANILASSLMTLLMIHYFKNYGVAFGTLILTLVILIFSEIIPKTMAVVHSQWVAFVLAWPLYILLSVFYPFVWLVNKMVSFLLKPFGIQSTPSHSEQTLSREELHSLVQDAGVTLPVDQQDMLIGLLELTKITVNDIMVPRNEIEGIDLNDPWESIVVMLTASHYTRLPVYRDTMEQIVGFLHLRTALNLLACQQLNKQSILANLEEAYFVPEGTSLATQLIHFRMKKARMALVVDEYGEIIGMITLVDILEEIVGDFATDYSELSPLIHFEEGGTYLVDGSVTLREINRILHFQLPLKGPKTLSGLVVEHLETIPQAATSVLINGYPIEVMEVKDNVVKTARIFPRITRFFNEESNSELQT